MEHGTRFGHALALIVAVLATACGGGGGGDPGAAGGGGAGGGGGGGAGGGGGGPVSWLLTVARAGAGTGSVASAPAGLSCGSTCGASFADGTGVTLTATPAAGSVFAGWSGDCAGAAATATVTMSAARSCTATFNAAPPSGTGTSADCDDPQGETPGRRIVKRYGVGTTTSYEVTTEVIGPTVRNGQSVIEYREVTTYLTGAAAGQASTFTSFTRKEGSEYRTYAAVTQSNVGGVSTTVSYENDPYSVFPTGLAVGETRSHIYTQTTTTNGSSSSRSVTDRYGFLGFQSVTVPAGTFADACRSTANGGEFWTARGTSIPLKFAGVELISATIDGVALRP